MIPIRDEIKTRIVPVVNYALIAANVLMFLYMLSMGSGVETWVQRNALVPINISSGLDLGDLKALLMSMFMHAGWMHLIGNMLYLWIFGDNIEESLGHVGYLVFYILGGAAAALAHILTAPGSQVPAVGASGAVAAALGAYLVLYPHSRVFTFIPLGFFSRLTLVPAIVVLGLWFVLQLFSGVASLGASDGGGVAFWAHIGGFVFGVLVGLLFKGRRQVAPERQWS